MFRIDWKLIYEGKQFSSLVIKLVLQVLLLVDAFALVEVRRHKGDGHEGFAHAAKLKFQP